MLRASVQLGRSRLDVLNSWNTPLKCGKFSSPATTHLYTPGADSGLMKLFSRSRSTSFSIRTCAGSRSLGSLAGRIISDWKNAARSLREEAAASRAAGSTLLSRDGQDKNTREWLVAHKQDNRESGSRTCLAFSIPIIFVSRIWAGAAVKIKSKSRLKNENQNQRVWKSLRTFGWAENIRKIGKSLDLTRSRGEDRDKD